jgi:hypothetical protein
MTSPVKSSGFAALKLIGILAVFALSGERVDVQFLSHDHPLEPGEIKLGMSNAETGRFGFRFGRFKQVLQAR